MLEQQRNSSKDIEREKIISASVQVLNQVCSLWSWMYWSDFCDSCCHRLNNSISNGFLIQIIFLRGSRGDFLKWWSWTFQLIKSFVLNFAHLVLQIFWR